MSKEEKYGFVYIWYDNTKHKEHKEKNTKRFYIGCHWGYEDDGYVCSSNWMRNAYRKRPQDFKRRILKTNISSREILMEEEYKWLLLIKEDELGKRYYNLRKSISFFSEESIEKMRQAKINSIPWSKGKTLSEEQKQKISESRTGKCVGENHPAYSKPMSEEQKQKISESRTGKCVGEDNHFFGKYHSEESIERMRQAHLGKLHSEEHKRKIGESLKGKYTGENHYLFGRIQSKETIEKRMKKIRGRKLSEEHIEKIRKSIPNRPPITEESRERMRQSARNRIARDGKYIGKNKKLKI